MSYRYDRTRDRLVGHDYPGALGNGWVQFEHDELELGARVAAALDDEEQAWWETIGCAMLDADEKRAKESEEARG